MIALFGGTFNPIHNGHIALAREVARDFQLDCVALLPCYIPVHRDEPEISAEVRKKLVELAIADYPELTLNTMEIDRSGPSYAVDTLTALKQQSPDQTICWMMGADSFNSFLQWKNPQQILQLANLIVCHRPGITINPEVIDIFDGQSSNTLQQHPSGQIVLYDMNPNYCTATDVRHRLKQGVSVDDCLSPPVLEFIRQNHLFNVSGNL